MNAALQCLREINPYYRNIEIRIGPEDQEFANDNAVYQQQVPAELDTSPPASPVQLRHTCHIGLGAHHSQPTSPGKHQYE